LQFPEEVPEKFPEKFPEKVPDGGVNNKVHGAF
jgi:hypothetical protein